MKKMLSILLAAILLLTSLAIPAFAEGVTTVRLILPDSYEHGTDEVIVAEIYLENNTVGVSAATFYIDLPACLTTADDNPDDSINPLIPVFAAGGWASDGEHRLSVGFMSTKAYKGDGSILTVNLVPTPDATKEDLENMNVVLGIREFKTGDDVTHKGEDDAVQVSKAPIEISSISCTHPETEKVEAKAPTCTEPGYSESEKCKFCGEPIGETQQIPADGHDFQFEKTIEEATCTNVGKDQYKCSRCGETEEREVKMKDHVKSENYKSDGTSHWLYCVNCDAVIEGTKEAHKPDTDWHNEDVTVGGHYHICSVCKAAVGVEEHVDKDADGECDVCKAALHEHIADTSKWIPDEEGINHYHACTVPGCKAQLDKTAHNLKVETKDATCTEKGTKTTTCADCGYEKTEELETIPHTPDTEWHTEEGSDKHWHICTVCGTKLDDTAVPHTYGEYTTTDKDHSHSCTVCKAAETAEHKESSDYKHDETQHWHYCEVCGYEYEKTEHASSKDYECDPTGHWKVCDECGSKIDFDPHTDAVLTPEKKATAEENGNVAYWYCPDCEKYFYDNNGKIGAGPYDSADEFITKYNAGCSGGHILRCVPLNDTYHMVICARHCGLVTKEKHNFNANGVCRVCGYRIAPTNTEGDVIEVEAPTEAKHNVETSESIG